MCVEEYNRDSVNCCVGSGVSGVFSDPIHHSWVCPTTGCFLSLSLSVLCEFFFPKCVG